MMNSKSLVMFIPCPTFKKALDVFVVRQKKRRRGQREQPERYRQKMGFIIKRREGVFDYCPIDESFRGVEGLTSGELRDITNKLMQLEGMHLTDKAVA